MFLNPWVVFDEEPRYEPKYKLVNVLHADSMQIVNLPNNSDELYQFIC